MVAATRKLLVDWEHESALAVAAFRADAGGDLVDADYEELIADLVDGSPEFAAMWALRVRRWRCDRRAIAQLAPGSIESSVVFINSWTGARTMAPTKAATTSTQKSAKRTSANGKTSKGFTDDEKAAMRERARELKAEAAKADGETELLAAIAKMQEPDRAIAKKLHALIKAAAPALAPKTWYGMPAYAKDGTIICFFQNAGKFKARYQTLGFSDKAKLDDGAMWPNSYALTKLTAAEEAKITALVKKAVR